MASLSLIPKNNPLTQEEPIQNYRLRKARIEKGLFGREVAKKSKITYSSYFAIEGLRIYPNKQVARNISRVLEKDPDYLFPQRYRNYPSEISKESGRTKSQDVFDNLERVDINFEEITVHEDFTKYLEIEELHKRINEVLDTLTHREREITKLYFGIPEEDRYTVDEIARNYKITRGRVRDILAQSFIKLQHPLRKGALEGFL